MPDLTYMDCWSYIAPLIPVKSESVRDGYVSVPDLTRVLREEYEIDIVGGTSCRER